MFLFINRLIFVGVDFSVFKRVKSIEVACERSFWSDFFFGFFSKNINILLAVKADYTSFFLLLFLIWYVFFLRRIVRASFGQKVAHCQSCPTPYVLSHYLILTQLLRTCPFPTVLLPESCPTSEILSLSFNSIPLSHVPTLRSCPNPQVLPHFLKSFIPTLQVLFLPSSFFSTASVISYPYLYRRSLSPSLFLRA